jgi:hypothetical protein
MPDDPRSASGPNRRELADLLRSRRERLKPEDVGLPPGTRRRTKGLRREEVAGLADVSTTYYRSSSRPETFGPRRRSSTLLPGHFG